MAARLSKQGVGTEYTEIAFDGIAFDSIACPIFTIASFVGIREIATEQDFDW